MVQVRTTGERGPQGIVECEPGLAFWSPCRRLSHCSLDPFSSQVDTSIQYGMIEAISHLIHRDYEAIVQVSSVSPSPGVAHVGGA